MKFDPIERLQQSNNKAWCPIPWITSSVQNLGLYRLCVQANAHRETRGVFIENGESASVFSHSLKESRNLELIKNVRKEMLIGCRPDICVRCNQEDDSGLVSRRALSRFNYENRFKELTLEDCLKGTEVDGTINPDHFHIKELDLRLGNKCNLKCRSCYPGESSGWYKEWLDTKSNNFESSKTSVQLNEVNGHVVASSKGLDWSTNSSFFKELSTFAPEFNTVHLVGGEPLLIEEHFNALEGFVASGQSNKITLDYNSNITLIPDRAIELWCNFKEVRIGYSIDGIGQRNEYIRHPSKWNKIEENLRCLDELNVNVVLWPTVTVMAYNVYYIPEIISWQIKSNFKKQNLKESLMVMVHHPLSNPIEMNAQVFPLQIKEMIKDRYRIFLEEELSNLLLDYDQETRDALLKRCEYICKSIIEFLFKKDLSNYFNTFLKRTHEMDTYREERFSDVFPELNEAILKLN